MHASSRRGVSAASVDKRPLIIKRITGCGKLWGFDGGTADGHKPSGAVYAKNSAGEAKEMRACSACAGDYEDPDRTTCAADDVEDGDGAGATSAKAKEFPAEE